MKPFYILLIAILSHLCATAQSSLKLELKSGYAASHMKDLKALLVNYERQSDFPLKTTNNFEPFFSFGGTATIAFRKWEMGADLTLLSTGGRVHYKDYSGEVGFDILCKSVSFGMIARYTVLEHNKVTGFLSMMLHANSSNVKFNEFFKLGDDNESNTFQAQSVGILATPMLGANYAVTKSFYAGMRLGFSVDTGGGLHAKGNRDAILVNDNGDQLLTNWSGLKAEVAVGFKLPI